MSMIAAGIAGAVIGGGLSAYGANASNKANESAYNTMMAPYRQELSQAQSIADQPFQQYGGALTAPLSDQEVQAGRLAGTTADEAQMYRNRAGTPFSGAAIQQYMNPYTQAVTDVGEQNLTQGFNTEMAGMTRKANMTDQYGFGRTAAETTPAVQKYQQEYGQLATTDAKNAYDSALTEFNKQQTANMDLAKTAGDATTSGVGALLSTGKDIREAGTQADQAQYNEFLRGQNWSRNQIKPLIDVLGQKAFSEEPTQTDVATAAIGGAMSGASMGMGLAGGMGGGAAIDTSGATAAASNTSNFGDMAGATSAADSSITSGFDPYNLATDNSQLPPDASGGLQSPAGLGG